MAKEKVTICPIKKMGNTRLDRRGYVIDCVSCPLIRLCWEDLDVKGQGNKKINALLVEFNEAKLDLDWWITEIERIKNDY